MMAGYALEAAARADFIGLDTTATGANGFPVRLRPTQLAERLIGSVLAHAEHSLKAERAGCGG